MQQLKPITVKSLEELAFGDVIFPTRSLGHANIKVGVGHKFMGLTPFDMVRLKRGDDTFEWSCAVKDFKVLRFGHQEETPIEHKPVINNPKIETKMSDTSNPQTTTGFQVMIPEQAIQERVDKLVMYKLRHEKVHGILTDVVGQERLALTKELKKELLSKVKEDFDNRKDQIIESFLESKRTQIHLQGELKAVIDNPTAHKELPKLINFLQLFKQAMIVGPTGLN